MTSTEIAVRDDNHRDTDSWVSMLPAVGELAQAVNRTDFVPSALRGSQPAVIAAILAGRELNLPPMQSLQHIHVIEGRPTLSAQMQRSLALAAGYEISIVETNTTRCIVEGRRSANDEWTRITWTMDDAKKAGLAGRQNWQRHPRRMLQARATAELCQLIFSDAIAGMASTEEMQDDAEGPGPESIANGHAAPAAQPAPRTARRGRATPQTASPAQPQTPAAAPVTPPRGAGEAPLPPLPGEEDPTDAPGAHASAATTGPAHDAVTAASPAQTDGSHHGTSGDGGSGEPQATTGQVGMMQGHFKRLGFEEQDREQRLATAATIAGLPEGTVLGSLKLLTQDQAKAVIDTLSRCKDRERLIAVLAGSDAD